MDAGMVGANRWIGGQEHECSRGGRYMKRIEDIENNTYVYTAAKTPWGWPTQTRGRKRINNKRHDLDSERFQPDEVGKGIPCPRESSSET